MELVKIRLGILVVSVMLLTGCMDLQESVEESRLKHPNSDIKLTDSEDVYIINDTLNNRQIVVHKSTFKNEYFYTNHS
jgi:PBP1b-binding outer membrane lipoprotein LpoB